MTISVARLRDVKNTVIGNPKAKSAFANDPTFPSALIGCLADPELAAEAAHVVASLSIGSDDTLLVLLRANAPRALLYALSQHPQPQLRAALARALRAISSSIAEVVGPTIWGLRKQPSADLKQAATAAIEVIVSTEALDVYLPFLQVQVGHAPCNTPQAISATFSTVLAIAQLLGAVIRTPAQATLVSGWSPAAINSPTTNTTARSKRGWEKMAQPDVPAVPIVAKWLVLLLVSESPRANENKLVEAVLYALAALAKENSVVSGYLGRSEHPLPLDTISRLCKSRSPEVQVAACLCLTHTLRSLPPIPSAAPHPPYLHSPHSHAHGYAHSHARSLSHPHHPGTMGTSYNSHGNSNPIPIHSLLNHHASTSSSSTSNRLSLEELGVRTVLNVTNRMLGNRETESMLVHTRACFVLHYLVADDAQLCHAALDSGCVNSLGALIQSLGPQEPAPPEWEESEASAKQHLREAALTALASLTLASDDVRRCVAGPPLSLLPAIARGLRATAHVGTRYAACQCVRAMSRSVSVLRTGVVDSGLGMDVLRIVLGQELGGRYGGSVAGIALGDKGNSRDRETLDLTNGADNGFSKTGSPSQSFLLDEDRRVLGAALSAVCNIVNDFSPLRPIYLEENLIPRLARILRFSGDAPLRVNALWAVKNLVRKASGETKRDVMQCIGWDQLISYLTDPDLALQEQAINLLRNLAENEEGITLVLNFLPPPTLLPHLVSAIASPSPDVVQQAAATLANLANGPASVQSAMCSTPGLLTGVCRVLEGAVGSAAARNPAVDLVHTLAKGDPRRRVVMQEAGILGTLRRVMEWGGGVSFGVGSPGSGTGITGSPSVNVWGGSRSVGGGGAGHLHSALGAPSSVRSAMSSAGAAGITLDQDSQIMRRARAALDWLEHGEMYAGAGL